MFLKNRNIIFKMKILKVTDYAALINFSILSVNCSHSCIIYAKIFEKILSGGLEVSFSIDSQTPPYPRHAFFLFLGDPDFF